KGQTLVLASLPDESIWVVGDALRLSQVLDNLLNNAVKYTEAGGQIVVTLESEQDKARIIVRDTGEGIESAFLPHVFDTFAQAPQTLERAKGGLGLGLSLVQRFVKMHGGDVDASSPGLGLGSEFKVTLPRLRERRAEKRIEGGAAPSSRANLSP